MKKKVLLSIVLLILPLIVWVGIAGAQSFRSGNNITVPANQNVDSSLWASGRSIDIAGDVNGDVFCAGQNVTISGTVDGDVLCAAQNIRIAGTVNGDIRLAGQSVSVSGKVGNNSTIAAQTFSLEQTGSIGSDISVTADEINLNGTIGRDAALAAKTVSVSNSIEGEVKARTENLTFGPHSYVGGDLSYTSNKKANVAKGAVIEGSTHQYDPKKTAHHRNMFAFNVLKALYGIVSLLIVALVFVLLLPQLFHVVSGVAVDAPLKVLLVGLVAGLVFPVVFIALLLTLIGIPLALLLLLTWLFILAFSGLFFSYYLGRLVLKNQLNPIIIMLVGALIVLVLYQIPILGFVVGIVALWMGSGMVLLSLKRQFTRPHYTVPQRETNP